MAIYDYKSMAEVIVYGITGQRYKEPANNEVDPEINEESEETITGDKDALYRVQVGAYRNIGNAKALEEKLKQADFEAIIVRA